MHALKRSTVPRAGDGFICASCLRSASSRLSLSLRPAPLLSSVRAVSSGASASPANQDLDELAETSFNAPVTSEQWDPAVQAQKRRKQLPPSNYQVRPPKYYRGPLHPHQPPKPSDPSSREFVPGPFSLPRLQQTFESTVAPDFMVLAYQHVEPGLQPTARGPRLRQWDENISPYAANRPPRAPRGGSHLRLLRKPITFRNIPYIHRITVHSFVNAVVTEGSAALHVGSMALQAVTGVRAQTHVAKKSVTDWGLKKGRYYGLTAELGQENAYHFLSRLIELVLPRIKDWKGAPATSGDGSGNITFGLTPEQFGYFPEVEVNYDQYPAKLIPGAHITIHTTAATDRDARVLLSAMGLPFDGEINHF